MESFDIIEFGVDDIVRSGLVKEYIIAKMDIQVNSIIKIPRWIVANFLNNPSMISRPRTISAMMTAIDIKLARVQPKILSSIRAHLKLPISKALEIPENKKVAPRRILIIKIE